LPSGEPSLRLLEGVGRPELWLLNGEPNIGVFASLLANHLGTVADDQRDSGWRNGIRGLQNMLNQRASGQRMQHLRQPGLHTGSLAGSEDNDVDF
jgi:hypothetical protein